MHISKAPRILSTMLLSTTNTAAATATTVTFNTITEGLLLPAVRAHLQQVSESTITNQILHPDVMKIGTHDGSFHCDEALAVSLLRLLPQYQSAVIVRTRNSDILAQCNIVVDVGAVYDPATHRYDHHQRGFTEVLEGFNTKLSSAGLVFKHFGKEILRHLWPEELGGEVNNGLVDSLFHKLYTNFIEHIDAIDNGISVSDAAPRYRVSTTLSDRIHWLNPDWNEEQTPELFNERFRMAMNLTCSEFLYSAQGLVKIWWPARSIVLDALQGRHAVHPSGQVMILDRMCPWKEHLFELEKELGGALVLYCLYQDTGGSWRIQAVPETSTSFESRKKLPSAWRGVRDEALSQLSGVPGCVFVHAAGFIGGHANKDGAMAMAALALTLE